MCKAYNIARNTVKKFLVEKDEFKRDELRKAILDKGGVMRIRSGYTVKDYLSDLERRGVVSYIPKERMYKVNRKIKVLL